MDILDRFGLDLGNGNSDLMLKLLGGAGYILWNEKTFLASDHDQF